MDGFLGCQLTDAPFDLTDEGFGLIYDGIIDGFKFGIYKYVLSELGSCDQMSMKNREVSR